ncbi:phospholipase A [Desulfofustis limnaeus]|jgi:phospholipase A1|uniref:Phosphatidylcholine 1-acylhydrolase n=1 Tax=Desulfofustis limnaeus TaxID=2740163 RepID=A0ABN6MAE6_9BACT|nr:phospholipase A [Desulfofustis limnaeus]MDX9895590.1 phospholipase A [Desulfofustis sp.]BDD88412.1 phospholipase [Desulfofustis limnaeus]
MSSRIFSFHLVAVLLWCSSPVNGREIAPIEPDVNQCHGLADPVERLACYDHISGRQEKPATAVGTIDRLNLPDADEATVQADQAAVAPEHEEKKTVSLIDGVWAFDPSSNRAMITTHQRNYALLARYSTDVNETPYSALFDAYGESSGTDPLEASFQISFKTRLWATESRRLGVWLAYTQESHWQVYNDDNSRPFRETNYQPELFLSYRPGLSWAGFSWNLLNLGYVHQSNGQSELISRSWDRLFAEFGVEKDNFGLFLKLWTHLPEVDEDENPDITDYYGYGDLTLLYRWGGHGLSLKFGGNPRTGKGSAEFSWVTPPIIGPLRGYIQLFSGYGESMIDYNWYQNTVGIGVALNDLY